MILTHKQEVLEHIGETSSSIYDKAYQQGRTDRYQEIISEYMLLTEKQVEEIRNDAIEELLSRILTHSNIFKEIGWDSDCIDISTIKIICDELKEQKNE